MRFFSDVKNDTWLLTLWCFTFVVSVGATLVSNPSQWWKVALAVFTVGLMTVLFVHARFVFKAFFSCFVILVFSALCYRAASFDPRVALLWSVSIVCVFLACVTISFVAPQYRSRWTHATCAGVAHGVLTSLLSMAKLPAWACIMCSAVVCVTVFVFVYFAVIRELVTKRPAVGNSDEFSDEVVSEALSRGWGAWKRRKNVLVWNDHTCYLVTSIFLDEKFGSDRRGRFTYAGSRIDKWLFTVCMSMAATVSTTPVFLDVLKTDRMRTFTVSVPDSPHGFPAVMIPWDDWDDVFSQMDKVKAPELSRDQVDFLDSHLPESV